MFNSIKLFLLALIFSVAVSGTASAGHQDFTLINQTGRDIINLYVTPSKSYYWNDDILGIDVLQNGESTHIVFDRSEPDRYWDMMATFSDGNDYIWQAIDLFSVSEITLRFDGAAVQR